MHILVLDKMFTQSRKHREQAVNYCVHNSLHVCVLDFTSIYGWNK